MHGTFKSYFFVRYIIVAHKASSVLLTCCTCETNENGKKNSLFMKSCFATSCIIVSTI